MTQMARLQVGITLFLLTLLTGCSGNKPERQILSREQDAALLAAIDPIQKMTDQHQTAQAKVALEQVKGDFPGIAQFDLGSFAEAELAWSELKRARAGKHYKKIITDYPDSVLYDPSMARIYDIGCYYLEGPLVIDFLFLKVKGYDRGITLLELVSDELGIDDPNGMGLSAIRMSAKNLQERKRYEDAFLKWLEISTVWESGEAGREALLGMAECKYASYQLQPIHRRPLFDTGRLEEARTYYKRYANLYPVSADELGLLDIIIDLDEQLALKQLTIAQFYQRTGEATAAQIYFERVVKDWPETDAADKAREQLDLINNSTKG